MAASGLACSPLALARLSGSQKGLPQALPDVGVYQCCFTRTTVLSLRASALVPARSSICVSLLTLSCFRFFVFFAACACLRPGSQLCSSSLCLGASPPPTSLSASFQETSETRRTSAPVFGTPLPEYCSHIRVGFCFIDHSLVSSLFLSGAGVALLLQLLLLFWPGMALSWLTRLASSTTTTLRTLSERCTDYCVGCIVTGGSLPLALCLCKKYMGRMDMCHEIACRQADKLFISI